MTFKTLKNIILLSFVAIFMSGAGCGNPATVAEIAAIAGLQLPKNVEVFQDDSAVASLAAVNSAAYNSTGTDYTDAKAEIWIDGGNWQQPLNMADMLICIMGGSMDSGGTLANETYLALVDMSQCDNEQGGQQKGKKTRFATASVVSSRVSNDSVQNVTAYFVDGVDQNGDGDITDAGETQHFAGQSTMTTAPSSANPYGAFTFDWDQANALPLNTSKGNLTFSDASTTQVGMTFIVKEICAESCQYGAHDFEQWASGELNKDGSGGKLKVSQVESGSTYVYKINYNATHANIDTDGTAVCKNLAEDSMTTYMANYNIYNSTTGALKDITAGLPFTYGADQTNYRGYAGSYTDGDGVARHWVWAEDGTAPTTIYKEDDTTVTYTISWSSGQPTVTGMTFDDPINFTASFLDSNGTTRTNDLNYEGPGQLWGVNWTEASGQWTPDYNIADGTELTATDGTKWRVKATNAWKTLATVASSNCSAIPIGDVDASFTKPTLRAVTTVWSEKPTITDKVRVIHGVLQY
jgi:hypothetical protein